MSVPTCLFFQDLEALTEVFGQMSAGISGQKLPLWAEFLFLIIGVGVFWGGLLSLDYRRAILTTCSVVECAMRACDKLPGLIRRSCWSIVQLVLRDPAVQSAQDGTTS